ncbi:hypothetical protein Tco_0037734 [Tanacetum coccineum]
MHTSINLKIPKLRWTKDQPLTQVRGNPSKSQCKQDDNLQQILNLLYAALTVSIVEPKKTLRKQWLILPWIVAMLEELHSLTGLQQRVMLGEGMILKKSFAPVARLEAVRIIDLDQSRQSFRLRKALYCLNKLEEPGSLMYLTSSRPDIVQVVCYCARYQARPTEKHLKEVKRIFRYLRGTIHMGLWYPKGSGFELTAFLDADHAGCVDTRKSTSGGIQFLGDKLVSWMSKKQDCTAMSSAEAEYVALSASCAQVMWMRTQLQDYGFNYNKIPLYCDSQSAIAISCNPVQHSRTKHIHTRYHFIKEQVENGIIELYFVRTEFQLADMFTKALPEERFQYLVRRIGMRCLTPAELEVLTNESA